LQAAFSGVSAEVRASIDDHIDNHPDLKKDRELLESIPAIGQR
jgi:transposase